MKRPRFRGNVSVFGFVCVFALAAQAQINTATLTGRVTDPTHAVIPGVHVQIINENTGFTKEAISNSGGEYTFSFLPLGSYTITAEANGFTRFVQKGVNLVAGQILRLDVQLRLGTATQTVTVSGTAPLLDRESSNQLQTVSNEEVRQLPQANLDWSALTNLGTGNIQSGVTSASSGSEVVSMNGLTGEGMSFTLDGSNASGTFDGPSIGYFTQVGVIKTVTTDAVQEIEVLRAVKSQLQTRMIPVVMLTSSKEERDMVESYSLDVNSYIQKSLDFN